MATVLEQRLSNTDDTVLVDGIAHRPDSNHARSARSAARTSVGHAHAKQVRWCQQCYPHGSHC
ncbi:hypothetical protein [Actinocatenispora rupis]|uniref:Uncharacterized protein n=1 Tax=Actinocatenispora rupis TaxID=519421 RepID=A0A8J3J9D0_9ACTN|nr:hypothetical protein [Actinocatenispora rupis]GID14086.1 hypothetical protein Aru02nite_49750 [Actinocatenispora rupis]